MANGTLYNPANLHPEDLISNFVVRTKIFDKIFRDIRDSDMQYPEKHFVIQGQRGMGKTTLLLRLKYEVEQNSKLSKWLIPVFFNEESYDVNSLSGFWEKLIKYLDEYFNTDGEFYDYTEQFLDSSDYEKKCFEYLVAKLKEKQKKLVVFFDNFGELFLDNLKDKEKRRLREILMTSNEIRIVAASAVVINELHDYSQPFYEFFHIIRLDGLSKQETFGLIEKLQENCDVSKKIDLKKSRAKIDALSILTGGVIRTIMMLYQVLLDDEDGSALEDLEKVLDKATPLYKHRIEDLPVQQRRIVDVIAKKWDAVSAREIAGEIREDGKKLATKLISAQLNQLEKNNIIEKKETNTKNNLYQVKERFFNIWYLMRNGDRRDRRRVAWLTKFLEMWYDDEDSFDTFIKKHIQSLKSGKYHPTSALMIAEALVNSDKISPIKLDGVIDETSALLNEDQQKYLPNINGKKYMLVGRYMESRRYDESVSVLDSIKKPDVLTYLLTAFVHYADQNIEAAVRELEKINDLQLENLDLFQNLSFGIKAYKNFERVVLQSKSLGEGIQEHALGDMFRSQNAIHEAELHYRNAISLGDNTVYSSLAEVLRNQNKIEESLKLLTDAYRDKKISPVPLLDYFLITNSTYKEVNQEVYALLDELGDDPVRHLYRGLIYTYSDDLTADKNHKAIEEFEKYTAFYTSKPISGYKYIFGCSLLLLAYAYGHNTKVKAMKLVETLKEKKLHKDFMVWHHVIFVQIWNNDFSEIEQFAEQMDDRFLSVDGDGMLNDILLLLMAKKQYQLTLRIFKLNAKLTDLLKPTYYALMTFLKGEFPNETLKMGEELKAPMEEILLKINEMAKEYK